jgi:hypothetical protein
LALIAVLEAAIGELPPEKRDFLVHDPDLVSFLQDVLANRPNLRTKRKISSLARLLLDFIIPLLQDDDMKTCRDLIFHAKHEELVEARLASYSPVGSSNENNKKALPYFVFRASGKELWRYLMACSFSTSSLLLLTKVYELNMKLMKMFMCFIYRTGRS